jgi:ubiquinone/menaquinone biosynthesis C-methylase UbiE
LYLSPADGFNELAPTYDQRLAGNPLFALESTALLTIVPDLVGKSVADIGCGTGRLALQLARMGADRVIGVDLSAEMLAVAARKATRGELEEVTSWKRGDILERLPLADASVDVVVCALTLSFLPNAASALREMARILAPGGAIILSDYHPHGLTQARAEALTRDGNKEKAPYLRFTSAGGDDCRIAQYVHTVSDLFRAGRDAGLSLCQLAEPVPDRQVSNSYAGLRNSGGVPLAIVVRFDR